MFWEVPFRHGTSQREDIEEPQSHQVSNHEHSLCQYKRKANKRIIPQRSK